MAKTKQIGVRFDIEILELIKKEQKLKSPQHVLNWLMQNYEYRLPINPLLINDTDVEATLTMKFEPETTIVVPKSKKPAVPTQKEVKASQEPENGQKQDGNKWKLKTPMIKPPDNLTGVKRSMWILEEKKRLGLK